ncbi:MAG: phosphoglycerate kinase [Deltaproteobacteria bacterium]|nr:phosphoglycerate kinase [Deltaproteobacteria bacterium]
MKFLKDISLKGKKILYRADLNSDIRDGKIQDDTRIRSVLPTLRYLLKGGVIQIIILAHQGREKNRSPESVLDLHAKRLQKLLKKPVLKLDQCRNVKIPKTAKIVVLENVRLDDEDHSDEKKRMGFAKALEKLGDVYVNDAFGACHRDHATISSLPKLMKEKAAGLLLQQEIAALNPLLHGKIESPFTIIFGGAKIDTKIGVLEYFAQTADAVLTGGGIANTFLFAEGYDIGESLCEKEQLETTQNIAMKLGNRLHLPEDVVCDDEITSWATAVDVPSEDVEGDMKILDVGKKTVAKYAKIIKKSRTVLWNGPLGYAEYKVFRHGTEAIAKAVSACKGTTIIGGGETVAAINFLKIPHSKFTHVSTGGGAMIEYLSGKNLPGIEALEN